MRDRPSSAAASAVVWGESLTAYNFGEQHPMHPSRLDLTARLATELGLFERAGVQRIEPRVATDAELGTVHDADYIEAVRRVSDDPDVPDEARGLGTTDDPAFAGMHEASARIAGGSLQAADAIVEGLPRAVNFSGGMHHAARHRASGFCIYNDAAVAVARLLDRGASRVLYIDVDAHHGDGTESIFWDDPRVMTISLHETGLALFPGTGFANDTGGPGAEGSAVNVALPPTTGDGAWLRAFHAIVPQLARAFAPDVIVSQHGCDSHYQDPLTDLRTSVDAQRQVALDIRDLAADLCGGRWLATGGGGYSTTAVVPRVWAHLVGIVTGEPVPVQSPTPARWQAYVQQRYGKEAPLWMTDDVDLWWRSWEVGYDPNDDVDRAVMATRKEVFPLHGLDPWFD
ncbi:acetoin utilization protein AcuC [Tersicoccus solisilvae]|uniref:Acetoin utilization protein AcuC n=1 Tax=Tersicoccus solisilvae TaxID=1882339 RepID=A0ABQ1NRV6_9MICC|nr:acetoin utilization protein AcuC [Tersicoccus solisilvae]